MQLGVFSGLAECPRQMRYAHPCGTSYALQRLVPAIQLCVLIMSFCIAPPTRLPVPCSEALVQLKSEK